MDSKNNTMTIEKIVASNFENVKQASVKNDGEKIKLVFTFENDKQIAFFANNTIDNKVYLANIKKNFENVRNARLNRKTIFASDMQSRVNALNEKMQNDILDCNSKMASYQKQLEKIQEKIELAKKYLAMSDNEKIAYIEKLQGENEKSAYLQAKRENASRPFARDIFKQYAECYGVNMRDIQKAYLQGLTGAFSSDFAKTLFDDIDKQIVEYMSK